MDKNDLALVTMDELLDELGRRCDKVAVLMDGPIGHPNQVRRWTKAGGTLAAIGLCFWAANDWSRDWTEPRDGEEDSGEA